MSNKKIKDFKSYGASIAERQSQLKRGRPLKNAEPLSESVTFRLTPTEAACLKDWCWRYDQAPSDVLRWALDILSITGI